MVGNLAELLVWSLMRSMETNSVIRWREPVYEAAAATDDCRTEDHVRRVAGGKGLGGG